MSLGVEVEVRPFAQSTLQHFRVQLVLHAKMRELFLHSLELAGRVACCVAGAYKWPRTRRPFWGAWQGYARYLAASLKGAVEIAWDEPTAREALLAEIVADATATAERAPRRAAISTLTRRAVRPVRAAPAVWPPGPLQHGAAFAPYRLLRQAVEHRLARLVPWGLRQARYMGRHKTAAQLILTAIVAHLTWILAAT